MSVSCIRSLFLTNSTQSRSGGEASEFETGCWRSTNASMSCTTVVFLVTLANFAEKPLIFEDKRRRSFSAASSRRFANPWCPVRTSTFRRSVLMSSCVSSTCLDRTKAKSRAGKPGSVMAFGVHGPPSKALISFIMPGSANSTTSLRAACFAGSSRSSALGFDQSAAILGAYVNE